MTSEEKRREEKGRRFESRDGPRLMATASCRRSPTARDFLSACHAGGTPLIPKEYYYCLSMRGKGSAQPAPCAALRAHLPYEEGASLHKWAPSPMARPCEEGVGTGVWTEGATQQRAARPVEQLVR